MNAKKITEAEILPLSIASLPTRPTASSAFGGKGYTATEMKEAFDLLPRLIIERFNALIDDIESGRISVAIPTNISYPSTLEDVLLGIESGELANFFIIGETTLTAVLDKLAADIAKIAAAVGVTLEV